jgi:hypothetical protein
MDETTKTLVGIFDLRVKVGIRNTLGSFKNKIKNKNKKKRKKKTVL